MITHQLTAEVRFSPGKVAVHRVTPGQWATTYTADPDDPLAGLDFLQRFAAILTQPPAQIRFSRTWRGAWEHAEQIARTLPRRRTR